jgi:hypothetical protein
MLLKRYFTKKRLVILSGVAVVYVALWLLTGIFGAPQVQHEVLWDYIPIRGKTVHKAPGTEDWCYARAYAPFVVRADYSFGPGMAGCGGIQLYFWAFGQTYKIRDLSYWVS